MKCSNILLLICLLLLVVSCKDPNEKDLESSDQNLVTEKRESPTTPRFPSPAASVKQTIGLSVVTINYSRPSIISPEGIDRIGEIWGELVPYDFNFRPVASKGKPIPWRAGANENTIIEFSDDAKVQGQSIRAGKYGLHMAIHENGGATVIFSNEFNSWGSFAYDQKDDALRVEVATEQIPLTERLQYTFAEVKNTYAVVALDWEKKRIPFKVEFEVHGRVMADFREYLSDSSGLKWSDFNKAAAYAANNSISFDEAMSWVERSIEMETNYTNLSTKASILSAKGKDTEAEQIKNAALEHSTTGANDYYSYGTSLIRRGMADKAMEIYQRQRERWPQDWLTAHGLARGYSALGDYQMALKYEKDALSKSPEVNKGFIESAIILLEQGEDFN